MEAAGKLSLAPSTDGIRQKILSPGPKAMQNARPPCTKQRKNIKSIPAKPFFQEALLALIHSSDPPILAADASLDPARKVYRALFTLNTACCGEATLLFTEYCHVFFQPPIFALFFWSHPSSSAMFFVVLIGDYRSSPARSPPRLWPSTPPGMARST